MTNSDTIERPPIGKSTESRSRRLRKGGVCPFLILTGFVIYFCYWQRMYFSTAFIPGWDLPGQIAAVDRMMAQLPHLRFTFYDPGWFFGWGVDLFYAPLYHILTALLALALSPISIDPAQLATHIGLGLGCALLPYSMWYFVLPVAKSIKRAQDLTPLEGSLLALSIGFFAFWFLNHDNQFYGIGWASVMEIGLYTQTLGWHLMLLHGGAVVRLIETGERKYEIQAIILYALLFFTHSLTAVFELGFTILLAVWFQTFAIRLLRVQILAIAIISFWLVPALVLNKAYTVLSTIKGMGDLLELIVRYPLPLVIRHIQSCLHGHFVTIDSGTFIVTAAFLFYIPLKSIRRSQIAIVLFVAVLVAHYFSSSSFIAKCFQVTVHYYRFLGDEILYLVTLMALVPAAVVWLFRAKRSQEIAFAILFIVLGCGVYSTIRFPMVDRAKMVENFGRPPEFQVKVLDYLASLPAKGRVFFEIFEDESPYGFLTAHYLESRCFRDTGFESVNGLFIESANNYRLAVTSANYLGAHAWATSQIYGNDKDNSAKQVMRQLKEFGITHIVCGAESPLLHKLQEQKCLIDTEFRGPYAICQIAPLPSWKIMPADKSKTLVGYVDAAGTLPYEYFQAYVYTHDALSSKIDLIDFTGRQIIPNIPIVVINTGDDKEALKLPDFADLTSASTTRLYRLNYAHHDVIDHYHPWYQENPDYDAYIGVVAELTNGKFPEKIGRVLDSVQKPQSAAVPTKPLFEWSKDYQTITLRNLKPGAIYKLDYTYLPFWHSDKAKVFKGSNEQMYVLPEATEVQLSYDQWTAPFYRVGVALSAVALLCLLLYSQVIAFGNRCIAALFGRLAVAFKTREAEDL